jgi:predicted DNA-binding protein
VGREYTEAQKKASIKYMGEKTDDIRLRLPKGTKERWKAAADAAGVSMTQYVREAVEAAIAAEKPGK